MTPVTFLSRQHSWLAAAAYTVIAVVMTWPLVMAMDHGIAADLADPIFGCWVMLWTGGLVLRALGGDVGALGEFWHGNIFHPEAMTVAFADHLTPQMLQMLPVYAVTGNAPLSYNVLFLSTFVLAGLAMFLYVRALTGSPLAAFVGGLAFAWAPYRLAQIPHIQILSSWWMPLVLLGFHRFFSTRRLAPLGWGSAALVGQNLSSGYYLLYFPPAVAAYCLYEMTRRRLLAVRQVWGALAGAAVAVALLTYPFARPYLELRMQGDMGVRAAAEVQQFSADTHAFATPAESLRLWAPHLVRTVRPEGEGFPGFTILLLALAAVVPAARRAIAMTIRAPLPEWLRAVGGLAAIVFVASAVPTLWLFVTGRILLPWGDATIVYANTLTLLPAALISGAVLIAVVAVAHRRSAADIRPSPIAFLAAVLAAAALFTLGPTIDAGDRPLGPGPYQWLMTWVPGFSGSRVPARFIMLVTLCLAALAGLGAAKVLEGPTGRGSEGSRVRGSEGSRNLSWRRLRVAMVALCGVAILAESWVVPMGVSLRAYVPEGFVAPGLPPDVRSLPPLYRYLHDLPEPVVLIELPFGEPAFDLMAMFHAGRHRRPLVNGYSGYFPAGYDDRRDRLRDFASSPSAAAESLLSSGATHVIVHEAAWNGPDGRYVSAWLLSIGARPAASDGPDRLFDLRPARVGSRSPAPEERRVPSIY